MTSKNAAVGGPTSPKAVHMVAQCDRRRRRGLHAERRGDQRPAQLSNSRVALMAEAEAWCPTRPASQRARAGLPHRTACGDEQALAGGPRVFSCVQHGFGHVGSRYLGHAGEPSNVRWRHSFVRKHACPQVVVTFALRQSPSAASPLQTIFPSNGASARNGSLDRSSDSLHDGVEHTRTGRKIESDPAPIRRAEFAAVGDRYLRFTHEEIPQRLCAS